ncbi:MAG: hypothetical protein KDE27_07265 [Planctomycetes bacterium]|nr:hypothetical protein [Planctomycetota bacterium]
MTATETQLQTDPETQTTTASPPVTDWPRQLAELQTRYPKVREPILAALHVLTENREVSLDEAKAQAAALGVRITAASVAAADRLLERQSPPATDPTPAPEAPAAPKATANEPRRGRARRSPRAAPPALDIEELVRATVDKIQSQNNAEAERLREAMRQAVAVLQAAVDR